MSRIRVRVIDQNPRLYLVDKIGDDGLKDPCELLTLTPEEMRDARLAFERAEKAPPRAYVTSLGGEVDES